MSFLINPQTINMLLNKNHLPVQPKPPTACGFFIWIVILPHEFSESAHQTVVVNSKTHNYTILQSS